MKNFFPLPRIFFHRYSTKLMGVIFNITAIIIMLSITIAIAQQQNIASDTLNNIASKTKDIPNVGGSNEGSLSSLSPLSKANSIGVTAPASQDAKEIIYSTDANTELLERAIERYNREECPPQTPITDINIRTLQILREYRLIPSDISKFEKMVLRDGKVYKPVEKKPTDTSTNQHTLFPTGKAPDSLKGVMDVISEGLNEKSPKGKGNPPPPTSIQLEERKGTFRNANGELVEFKYWDPKVPPVKSTTSFPGKIQHTPTSFIENYLPPKFINPHRISIFRKIFPNRPISLYDNTVIATSTR